MNKNLAWKLQIILISSPTCPLYYYSRKPPTQSEQRARVSLRCGPRSRTQPAGQPSSVTLLARGVLLHSKAVRRATPGGAFARPGTLFAHLLVPETPIQRRHLRSPPKGCWVFITGRTSRLWSHSPHRRLGHLIASFQGPPSGLKPSETAASHRLP